MHVKSAVKKFGKMIITALAEHGVKRDRLEAVEEMGAFIRVGLCPPLYHHALGVGLVLNIDAAIVVGREIIVPSGDYRPAPGVHEVD